MSTPQSDGELRERVLYATRKLGSAAALFSQAIAERVGLAITDVESLEILFEEGPVTAGRLAELSGLTSGATTRMIDRLEQAGYARRVADPTDRRRVLVESVPERLPEWIALHQSIADAASAVIGSFDEASLRSIAEYLERSVEVARSEALKVRAPADEGSGGGAFAAPVAGVTSARLVFVSGAPFMTIRGDPSLRDLYRARFDGPVPRVRVRGGVVTIAYPRLGWFDWRASIAGQQLSASVHWGRDRGEISLNASVPWAIELRGGASRLTANLHAIRLESFELRGGANKIQVHLPRPAGVVPIRIGGGMSQATIMRPAGTAAVLEVRGGASYVNVDGERIRGEGRVSLGSPEAARARERYEIEIAGGASKISIGTE